MPSSVDRSHGQLLPIDGSGLRGSGSSVHGACAFFTSGSGATADRIRGSSNGSTNIDSNITGADLSAGATLIIQGFYREA